MFFGDRRPVHDRTPARATLTSAARSRSVALLSLLCLTIAFGALVGCGSSPYVVAQETWTRQHEAYDGFDTQAFIYATLKTAPFRRAYVTEYTRLFALTSAQEQSLVEAELDEDLASFVVIAAFYTADTGWNDLDPARGIWEVRLQGPRDGTVGPERVTRLQKRNPTWEKMYPYFGLHYVLYELRFPRVGDDGALVAKPGEPLRLIVAGAPATIELEWTLPTP